MPREAAKSYDTSERLRRSTIDDLIRAEKSQDARFELVAGVLYAQAGVSRVHSQIEASIVTLFTTAALTHECITYTSGVRLRVSDGTVYHPDVSIVCDSSDEESEYISRPCVVVEILSPSTADIDRREKRLSYEGLPSLLAYFIVHQNQQRIERYWRDSPSDAWQSMIHTGGAIPVPCVDIELGFEQVYRGIRFRSS